MFAHGTGDDNVHFANTAELLNALIDDGRYPDHCWFSPAAATASATRTLAWWKFRGLWSSF